MVQGQGAVFVVDGHHGLGEAVFFDGHLGALLALVGEAIHVFPADPFQGGNKVRANPLVPLGVQVPEGHIVRVEEPAALGGGIGHHFRASGDYAVFHARHDAGGGEVHGGDAGAAEAVQGDAAGGGVPAREEEGHATEAGALLALLGARTPDHVVHLSGVEVIPGLEGLQHRCAKVLGVQMRERALALLPNAPGRPRRINNPSFLCSHVRLPHSYELICR